MGLKESFKKITGFYPYDFQMKSMEFLSRGDSLILMAPTGSGKSEVAMIPFILNKNKMLPSQMIYSLPTRTLIENLSKRAQKYALSENLSTAFHHGKRIESELFNEDLIITTIDQTVGAYVCTPLSAPIKRGNILAGAVSSAFLVFDEIHTFDPDRGLQTTITLAEHSSKLGLPFAIMSATLPDLLINKIKRITGKQTRIIKVENEDEIKSRKDRNVILHTKPLREDTQISVKDILGIYNSSRDKKLIIVCNTVDKSQQIYQELIKVKELDACTILLHSRFLDKDRKEKEDLLQELFSRKSKEPVILVSTQVIEVGMDISSNTIISEVAPVDSLIQRAGRCARWGGDGDFHVFNIGDYGPYREKEYQQIVDKTRDELKRLDGEALSWNLEKELINNVLSNHYKKVLDDFKRTEIMGTLARAVFDGNRSKAEETVREAYTCNVSIHNDPKTLCNKDNDIFKLQKVGVNIWVFRSKARALLENGINIWSIEESNILDDYTFRFTESLVSDANSQILPFKHYVVSPEGAYYDKSIGLIFGRKDSKVFPLSKEQTIENKENEFIRKYEPWIDHANKTSQVLDRFFISGYDFAINKFSKAFKIDKKDLIEKLRFIATLHDVGKLNKWWQKKIEWDGQIPLAHTDKESITRIGIPHATVSAVILGRIFKEWEDQNSVGIPFYLSVAHHHSPKSQYYRRFSLIDGWKEVVKEVVPDINLSEVTFQKNVDGYVEIPMLSIADEFRKYRLYSFISKIIRLSDWMATSGERIGILCS